MMERRAQPVSWYPAMSLLPTYATSWPPLTTQTPLILTDHPEPRSTDTPLLDLGLCDDHQDPQSPVTTQAPH